MKPLYNISDKSYSSKIILLGEYAVIHEGEILATPLSLYNAQWQIDKSSEYLKSGLQLIYDYLQSKSNKKIDLELFLKAIKDGALMQSNIPSGYGLGSSGAITAGIYDAFVPEDMKATNTYDLKQDLIDIESCFHGVSSGIDPLVIYLNQSIHIDGNGIHILEDTIDLSHYFLIDTHAPRKTSSLVKQYVDRTEDESYMAAIDRYKKICATAIRAQLSGNQKLLSSAISDISHWQYKHLDFAILDDYRDLWKYTLDRDDLSIKLCGAGGGGFLLGYAHDVDNVLAELSEFDLVRL